MGAIARRMIAGAWLVAMLAGACGGASAPGPPTQAPSDSAVPSASPEPSPVDARSDGPPAYEPGLGANVAAITLVGDLRVRSLPSVGESSARLEPLLPAGVRLYVVNGGVAADGYSWYKVIPADSAYPTGWVAAGSREGEPWIGSDTTSCPESPVDAADISALEPWGGLLCYGVDEIQVTGVATCALGDVDNTIGGPTWLRSDAYCAFEDGGSPSFFFHPDGVPIGYPFDGQNVIVTGHFSDNQASDCEWGVDPPAPDPDVVVAMCRAMFVVTDMQGLPIDEG